MLKTKIAAVLSFTASTVVSAGMFYEPSTPACLPGSVTVPCEAKQWDLGIQALYFQPIYGASRAYERISPLSYNLNDVSPDWGLGYRLEGSYHFNTGNDISATWVHYDADSRLAPYYGAFYLVTRDTFFPAVYRQYVDNRFDQVNLIMGQLSHLGLFKNARFYGGLQYADIQVDGTYYYNLPTLIQAGTLGVRTFNNTDFNGVGPVVGIDYSYDLRSNFSLTANTAASIVYGSARYNRADVYGSGLVAFNEYASRRAVVPSLEAKLGANYAYAMAQGMLNIQGGYHVLNYFNALQSRELLPPMQMIRDSDFGLYGPYFGVRWLG